MHDKIKFRLIRGNCHISTDWSEQSKRILTPVLTRNIKRYYFSISIKLERPN